MMPNTTVVQVPQDEYCSALIKAFAEGFVYLAEHELLGEFQDILPPEAGSNKA